MSPKLENEPVGLHFPRSFLGILPLWVGDLLSHLPHRTRARRGSEVFPAHCRERSPAVLRDKGGSRPR